MFAEQLAAKAGGPGLDYFAGAQSDQIFALARMQSEGDALFEVRLVVTRNGDRWGVRYREGGWSPRRFFTEEKATAERDRLTLVWLEGKAEVLVDAMADCQDGETC